MKIISMYLPQFHRVKENDEWWGEGFTEWSAVTKAEALFENHHQPKIPLNYNYYNLLEKKTMSWQMDLMKQYGIDAQCFYHYWFKGGKKILEKPAENLLQWKEIDMPFCFCWANETWARSWGKIKGNVWANTFEKKVNAEDDGILLEQKYGEEKDWKKHFDYLLPFFKDERYVKINNRPVFVIYKVSLIRCLREMIDKWKEWALEEGLNGLYFIGANNRTSEKNLDAVLYHEPQHTMNNICYENKYQEEVIRLEYDVVWNTLLKDRAAERNAIYGGFVNYDDTPRRGRKGVIVEHGTPEKFGRYLSELMAKNDAVKNELVFINAWNEWGEGMYLEPDEKYQHGYLEAVLYAKTHYKEHLNTYMQWKEDSNNNDFDIQKETEFLLAKCDRYESYWRVLDAWLSMKEKNIQLDSYFVEHGFNSIAIYGVGMLGKHLLKELESAHTSIKYLIDRNPDAVRVGIPIYSPDSEFPTTDAIVVTVSYDFYEIREDLEKRGYKNIISLEEIMLEMC